MTSSWHGYGSREKDVHVETPQEIPVNEVPENEAFSPTCSTDGIFFIDLANKQLQTILPGVLSLEYLEKNVIVSIPRDINCLRHMKLLCLDQNHQQDICEELRELKCLLSLDLNNNSLSRSSLPVISNSQALCQLRLNLHEIPVQTCEYLPHVELLGLSDNNFKGLQEIVNLTKLKGILQRNRFESFPKELCHIADLEILDQEQNLMSLIVQESFLKNSVKLLVAFINLSSIPPTLQHCQKLVVLDLSQSLPKLPPGLKNLTERRVLRLSANSLAKLPHQICRWLSLSRVYLSNTELCTVPGSFTRLTSVRVLHLSENCFGEIPKIPAEVEELTHLKCHSLSGNQSSVFPKEIFLLESLERLLGQSKGIKLTSLSEDISNLKGGATEGGSSWSAAAGCFRGLQLLPNAGPEVLLISVDLVAWIDEPEGDQTCLDT
ncbi:LOW QUALITY PROTEIN: leucine-rich repeat and IQ domain-containing protein 4 [Rhynochetos jubatus]